MPSVVNGFGTWYYGKRRIHRVKAVCSQCNSLTELESYDTTLYIVAIMVPLAPIGQKRIIEECQHCRRHRVAPLKSWEAAKAQAFTDVLEKLQANPDNKETIQGALGLATAYQDEVAFNKLAEVLGDRCDRDADIQAQLGSAYEYFSRWPEAEAAYSRSMTMQPNEEIGERLAVCMLKQNRPEDAIRYLNHVFESKNPDKAWLTFWLIEGCMAKGLHEQALALMDARDAAFPSLVNEKSYQRQRRTAEKHRATGKPIPSVYLSESSKTGYKEGSGLGFKWPRYVAAAIFLGLLGLYLGAAWYKGRHRDVYLTNGWNNKPYAVKINGQEHQLQPGVVKKIELPEGDVTVDWPLGGEGPQQVRIQTGFFGRPFHHPVFVINPDRFAILVREETIYSSAANNVDDADMPIDYSAGKLLHEFNGVDYEFQPFPGEIQIESSRVRKSRVGLLATADTQDRLFQMTFAVPANEQTDYVKRLLRIDPDDYIALAWLASRLSKPEMIALLKPRLADRPIWMEWHRIYQSIVDIDDPSVDLKPEYRRLVEETKRSPDAVYLLGRLEDGATAEKLYLEAAQANPPCAHACNSLGYRYLVRGDFEAAATWSKKAAEINPTNLVVRRQFLESLLAAGKYKDLIVEAGKDPPNRPLLLLHNKLAAMLALGDKAGAEMETNRYMSRFSRPGDARIAQPPAEMRSTMDAFMALVQRDRAKFLALAEQGLARDQFTVALLKGDLKAAASTPPAPKGSALDWKTEALRAGLLYLAAVKKKDAALADEQWKKFGEALAQGDRDGRRLARAVAGKEALDAGWMLESMFRPSLKRVLLAAMAGKFPAHAAKFNPLAKKLDFDRDSTSLCLRYLME